MKLHVAYDQKGQIVTATEAVKGADLPVGGHGLTVAELEVPKALAGKKFQELVHELRVDIQAGQLAVQP